MLALESQSAPPRPAVPELRVPAVHTPDRVPPLLDRDGRVGGRTLPFRVPLPRPPGEPERFELSTDALFAFGRSDLEDIQPQGREALVAIASQLKEARATIIQVVGHTDRIGSDADNQALSQRRAQTVREFLIQNGVAADGLSAHGVGESEPVKQCPDSLSHSELVACLQPNRRVEVLVMGFQ